MIRLFSSLTALAFVSIAAHAATTTTTLTVDASGPFSGTSIKVTGSATLSGIGAGSFNAEAGLSNIDNEGNVVAPFTITLSGGTLTGTVKLPSASLLGGALTGSVAVLSGTGTYAGATGSFPSLSGSATLTGVTFNLKFTTGSGAITTGGSGGGPTTNAPTISAVLDAGSYTKNIAQGSIFVVKGTNLSAAGFTQLGFPLPPASNGVKITFTPAGGGAGVDANLVYLYNQDGVNQLAAVLPSTLAPGNYNVTVTNGTAVSAGFGATVVQRKPGIITQDSTGSGLAVVQNFISQTQLDVDRFTTGSVAGVTISPAKPGQVLIAWLTGLGPQGPDNAASPGHDFLADGVDVKVIVGGVSITPQYAGRAPGLAGADQINFVLPANVPTGCTVSFQVSVAGQLSNPSFISIAPSAGANACVSSSFTTAQLQGLDQGGSFTVGGFVLQQVASTVPQLGAVKQNLITGSFIKFTGSQLATVEQSAPAISTGACRVSHSTSGSGNENATSVSLTMLDAGTITLTGPAGSNLTSGVVVAKDATTNTYSLSLGGEPALPGSIAANLVGGTYSLHGAGGKDVGVFDASVTLGAPLTITGGLPAAINRSSGLRLAWTGGNPTDIVSVSGTSTQTAGAGPTVSADVTAFTCTTTAGQGGITIAPDILQQLPATPNGSLSVFSSVNPTNASSGLFSAPLTAGGRTDAGLFSASFGVSGNPSYQ
jgi:uncharacterized protein (TIGR03437 family)